MACVSLTNPLAQLPLDAGDVSFRLVRRYAPTSAAADFRPSSAGAAWVRSAVIQRRVSFEHTVAFMITSSRRLARGMLPERGRTDQRMSKVDFRTADGSAKIRSFACAFCVLFQRRLVLLVLGLQEHGAYIAIYPALRNVIFARPTLRLSTDEGGVRYQARGE